MILLVPVTPEVPKARAPRLWPGLVLVLILGIAYLEMTDVLEADSEYLNHLSSWVKMGPDGEAVLSEEGQAYLKLRPLLRVAPARGDWDIPRLFYANFLHGGPAHLLFNLIGAFAGARICATFLPFGVLMLIYVIGGSCGLLASMVLTTQISDFIPHLGSSAGIFALMGTYYMYNFRYRTKYFFWFPSRRGMIALKTSWFFFLDVILLEILLSAAQLFPGRLDIIDHIAHVVGFSSGVFLAIVLRAVLGWPRFLQTRAEFIYWKKLLRPRYFDPVVTPFLKWLELLSLNAYNDQIKFRLCRLIYTNSPKIDDGGIGQAFQYLSPTFIRLHTDVAGAVVLELLSKGRTLPVEWLKKTPYDSIIRLARVLAKPNEEQHLLFQFVSQYRRAHPEGGDIERKLELLMQKLSGIIPAPGGWDGKSDSGIGDNNPTPTGPGSPSRTAKRAS